MSKSKKIFASLTIFTLTVMLVGPTSSVKGLTVEELRAQIKQLQEQLAQLQQQLAALEGEQEAPPAGTIPSVCEGISFERNLTVGMTGDDVKCLQALLNTDEDTKLADSGPGSPGNETTYFGPLTKGAVIRFQEKYADEVLAPWGLTSGTGFVGRTTRKKLNSILSAGISEKPAPKEEAPEEEAPEQEEEEAPTAQGLTVALAEDTPSASVIPDGSLYNPILKLKLSAEGQDVTVTGITVTRGGYIANTYVTGVSVWDDQGNRLGNIITALTADGKATIDFGESDLVISAGQSRTITVKANISAAAGSGTINFKVASASDIATEGEVTINGTFPIVSNTMSITDGSTSLGDVRVQAVSVGALTSSQAQTAGSGNVSVGNSEVIVGKFRFTQNNSKEAIQIEKVVIYVEGTVNEEKDLKNFKLYAPDGTLLASVEKAVDRYVTFNLDTPYTVDKGISRDLTVKADILDGSSHWFRVQIQNDYDIVVKGATTGAYLEPKDSAGGSFDAGTDGADANSYFRIKVGTLTVSKAPNSPSGNVSPGDQNIVLAKFNLKAVGEKIEIRKMGLFVKYASGGEDLTGTIKVQDADTNETYLSLAADTSGLQGTSAPANTGALSYQNLSTYIVIESGDTKTINIIGTIPSTASNTDNYRVYVGKFYVKRYASNDYTTLADNVYAANQLDVGAVSLTVAKNASFAGKRVSKGSTAQIGEFILGASSADDIKISGIKITLSTTTGVQNLYLTKEDGTQIGTTVDTPSSAGDTLTVDLTISRSTSQIIKVYAYITTDFSPSSLTATIPQSGITGYGVGSSQRLSTTPSSAVASNSVTVGTPTLAISRAGDAPTSQIILAGKSGVELNKIKFEASYEDLTLKLITLQVTSASSTLWDTTSTIPQNFTKIYLYDGGTLVGSADLLNGVAAITGITVTLPADVEKVLTVKADISSSGALASKSVGGIKVMSTSSDYLAVYSSTGVMDSGITLTNYAASNYFLFTDTAPTVTAATGWDGTRNGEAKTQETIAKYVIENPGTRTLTLSQLRLVASLSNVSATTTSRVTAFKLYDVNDNLLATSTLYSDSNFSTAVSQLDGVTNTVYVKFDLAGYGTTEEIDPGASKTYVIKADTLNIEAGESNPTQVTVRLSTYIGGEKGYDSTEAGTPSNTSEEYYWKDSYLIYSYTPAGGSTLSGLRASDSVPVYGATLKY